MNAVNRSYGPQDFPRLAKEMGFCFSLRRGRVDWHRIDGIDVDRLVQDRDLVSLQENLLSIINYNLDSEFDVKILDSNFVKLFRLAQLAIDYLTYSEQYLYNCIQAEHEEKNRYMKEIERLKREGKKKDCEIKNLKKKQNKLQQDANHMHKHSLGFGGEVLSNYCKCVHCGKLFLTAGYLEAHHGRRHPGLTLTVNHSKTASPDLLRTETERLQSEIKELKERLNNTERLFHTAESSPVLQDHGAFMPPNDIQTENVGQIDDVRKEMEEWQKTQHHKHLEEIAALKAMFTNELQRLGQRNQQEASSYSDLQEQIQKQEKEILMLREKLNLQSSSDFDSIQSKMDAQERLWKSKLKQVEVDYRNEVEQLKAQLQQAEESQKMKELFLEETEIVKVTVATNTDPIEIAIPPKPVPASEDTNVLVQSRDIVNIGDSSLTLAELTTRIENAIRASQGISVNAARERDKNENSPTFVIPEEKLVTQTLPQKPCAKLKKSMSDPISQIKSLNIRRNTQSIKPGVTKSLFSNLQPPKTVTKLSSESSDESFTKTENPITASSAMLETDGAKQQVQASSSSAKAVDAWSSAQSLEKEPDSLVGSKDSGLDSPKRILSVNVATPSLTKVESFSEKNSLKEIKFTPELSKNETESENEDEEMSEEEEQEEEEEEEEEEEQIEEEEETEEEEDEDETSPEENTGPGSSNNLAVRNIESLEDALKQNPQILEELKGDLRELLARRLRELGIDPEWKGIPSASFRQKKATLRHHQKITAKQYKSYFKIRKKLLVVLQGRMTENEKRTQDIDSDNPKKLKQDKRPQLDPSQQRKAVRTLVGKVKSKALSVLLRSKSAEALQTKSSTLKTDVKTSTKSESETLHKNPNTLTSKKLTLESDVGNINHERRRKHVHVMKKKDNKTSQPFSKSRMAEVKMRMYPRSSKEAVISTTKSKVVTSTPYKNKNLVTFVKGERALKEMHAESVSSLDKEEETEDTDKEKYTSEDDAEKEATGTTIVDLHSTQTQEDKSESLSKMNLKVTAIKAQEIASNQLTSPQKSKSALKTASSSSIGSLTKKHVLFMGQEDDSFNDNYSSLQKSRKNSLLATSRFAKSNENIASKPTTSWSSNANINPSKSMKFTSGSLISHKTNVRSESDSEWSFDSDDVKRKLETSGSEKIQLSTKQSPLIAQLSKDIQKQLSERSGPPPAGSVETMFKTKMLMHSSSEQSLISDRENDMNLGNKHSSNNTAPKPKPRSSVPTSPSKLSASDWDLEDLDD